MKPKNNEELKALIKDGHIILKEDLICNFDINVDADIKAWNIKAGNIRAKNIKAEKIEAWKIKAEKIEAWKIKGGDIEAWKIKAGNIEAWDIDAWDIEAWNIDAWNINAWNIEAKDIVFYAVCFAFESFKCRSIKGTRQNAKYFCLDSEVIVEEE